MDPETIGVKAAQDSFSLLVDRVSTGEGQFLITRRGKPAAVLMNVDDYAEMRQEIARLSGKAG